MHGDDSALRPATVQVSGEATVATEPDEAFVWIVLQARSDAPGSAFEAVASLSERLAQILNGMAIGGKDRAATGVNVGEEFDHTSKGRKSLGYAASASVSVRLADREKISQLMQQVTSQLDARVTGPRWQVSPENPAWLEAATFAAANASARAQAYAAGVGAQLGRLISLTEPDNGWDGRKMSLTLAASGGDVHTEPGEQAVSASVKAIFELVLSS